MPAAHASASPRAPAAALASSSGRVDDTGRGPDTPSDRVAWGSPGGKPVWFGRPAAAAQRLNRCADRVTRPRAAAHLAGTIADGPSTSARYQRGGFVPWTRRPCGVIVGASGCSPNRIAWSGHSGSSGVQEWVVEPWSSTWSIDPSTLRTSLPPSGSSSSCRLNRRARRAGVREGSRRTSWSFIVVSPSAAPAPTASNFTNRTFFAL